jgi:hypothetical protein
MQCSLIHCRHGDKRPDGPIRDDLAAGAAGNIRPAARTLPGS